MGVLPVDIQGNDPACTGDLCNIGKVTGAAKWDETKTRSAESLQIQNEYRSSIYELGQKQSQIRAREP